MGVKRAKPGTTAKSKRGRAVMRQEPRLGNSSDSHPCVVGIGASAGGFDALVEFLHVLPADSGLAFIILQHLSPTSRSLSAELFSRHTEMSVRAAAEGVRLQANCVYTTPADKD